MRHLDFNAQIGFADNQNVMRLLAKSEKAYDDFYSYIEHDYEPKNPPTGKKIELSVAARHRNADAWGLDELLVRRDDLPSFALPIRCGGRREKMIAALHGIGVVPGVWSDKWSVAPGAAFVNSRAFYNDHLLLPINEDVTTANIRQMANVVSALL